MFARNPQAEVILRALLSVVILFNALAPTAASASSAPEEEQSVEVSTEAGIPHQEGTKVGRPSNGFRESSDSTESTPAEDIANTQTEVQTPSVSLSADPDYLTPNTGLSLTWTIEGLSIQEHPSLQLQITIPEVLTLQPGYEGSFDETTRTLTLTVTALSGQVNLVSGATVSEAEIRSVLSENGQTVAGSVLLLPVHGQYLVNQQGGEIVTRDGKVKIKIPANTFKKDTYIEVGKPSKKALPGYSLNGQAFEIKAKDKESKVDLHTFDQKIEIEVSYADLDIPEEDFVKLFLYWYNPETEEWEALPSSADPETKTLVGVTDHFSVFEVGLNQWQAARMPTVDDFQVSQFTGAGTFSLPIEVPPGPGGLQPSLALTYNSQVVDQALQSTTQASWVGMGWSLETGSIEINTGKEAHSFDDTYFLNVGGISARLVPDSGGVFHAADENFWKFDYNQTAGTWTVWDKMGNVYYFEQSISLFWTLDCDPGPYGGGGGVNGFPYKWVLTRVKNIHNQVLQYNYVVETKDLIGERYTSQQNCVSDEQSI